MTTPITVEIGTTRSLSLVGRDMAAAAIAARDQGVPTSVLYDGKVIAAVAPADRVAGAGEFVVHLHDADPDEICQCGQPGTYARVAPNPFGQG